MEFAATFNIFIDWYTQYSRTWAQPLRTTIIADYGDDGQHTHTQQHTLAATAIARLWPNHGSKPCLYYNGLVRLDPELTWIILTRAFKDAVWLLNIIKTSADNNWDKFHFQIFVIGKEHTTMPQYLGISKYDSRQ